MFQSSSVLHPQAGELCFTGNQTIIHAPPGDTNQIGEKVTIGHNATIHGKHIGNLAVIGMGSVLSIWSEIGEWAIVAEGSIVKQPIRYLTNMHN